MDHEEMRRAYLRALAGAGPVVERREPRDVTPEEAMAMLEMMTGRKPVGEE